MAKRKNIKSGIYKIRSRTTDEFYVGKSVHIANRQDSHLSELKLHKHGNHKLQNIYDKFGRKDLEFSILEEGSPEFLQDRERYYINKLRPQINICIDSYFNPGRVAKKYKNILLVSPEGKIFTKIDNLNKFCIENNLIYENLYGLLNHYKYKKSCCGWYLIENYEEPPETIYFSDLSRREKAQYNIVLG